MRLPALGALCAALVLWLATAAWADVPVPTLTARVTDLTGTLSTDQRRALEGDLQGLEARSGSQIAVLLVPTTQPEAIEQYSLRVVEAWRLGQKGKDNGLLLVVAKNDRKLRIEVGYGLEGTIPDAVAKRVIDETITPHFKQGDYVGGIAAGILRLTGLIEGRAAPAVESAPEAPAESASRTIPAPSGWPVMDMTGTLSDEQSTALSKDLNDFYQSGRTKPVFVLVVQSTQSEPIAQYAARIMKTWGTEDNLDVDRSLLLLIAKDEGAAYIEAGAGLQQRLASGATERVVAEVIEPQLKRGEFVGAIQSGVQEIEKLIDSAAANKSFGESLVDNISEVPIWLVIALVVLGTALRWFVGPLFGGLAMGGAMAVGAWFIAKEIEIAMAAGAVGFLFVLVGITNWIGLALSGSSSSSGGGGGGGGFSGGGGDFGGGGASGSW